MNWSAFFTVLAAAGCVVAALSAMFAIAYVAHRIEARFNDGWAFAFVAATITLLTATLAGLVA